MLSNYSNPIMVCLQPQLSEMIAFRWALTLQVTPKTPGLVLFIWGIAVVSIHAVSDNTI